MSNDIIIEAWNTVLFEKFSRFKFLFIHGYADMSKTILDRIDFSDCSSILEVGCGFGDCALDLAIRAGENVKVIGIDCAQNFIDECDKEKTLRGVILNRTPIKNQSIHDIKTILPGNQKREKRSIPTKNQF